MLLLFLSFEKQLFAGLPICVWTSSTGIMRSRVKFSRVPISHFQRQLKAEITALLELQRPLKSSLNPWLCALLLS